MLSYAKDGKKMNILTNALHTKTIDLINNIEFQKRVKYNSKYFTRNRILNFPTVIVLCLSMLIKSLQVELIGFISALAEGETTCSKQAFSKARYKIKPEAFKSLYEMTVRTIFNMDAIGRYRGYRIFAIDGTILTLPPSKGIRSKFKPMSGSRMPNARASFLYDVVTSFIVDAQFGDLTIDERSMGISHMEAVKGNLDEHTIIIMDRGYPSKELISYFDENKLSYIMRLSTGFSAEIDNTKESDFKWEMCCKGNKYQVRAIKVKLSSGEIETLITNIQSTELSSEDFKELYNLRWGIEKRYNTFKNEFDIEEFSGRTEISLIQDFYARVYIMNFEAAIKKEADELIAERDKEKPHKHMRKANENILIGILKKNLPRLCMCQDKVKSEIIIEQLVKKVSRYTVDIVPDRSFQRFPQPHRRSSARRRKCL
jgi:hypothetical protein